MTRQQQTGAPTVVGLGCAFYPAGGSQHIEEGKQNTLKHFNEGIISACPKKTWTKKKKKKKASFQLASAKAKISGQW